MWVRQEEMKPHMLEKSVCLKERTRCEVGSAEGHLVKKSKERIKWSLFPTGGRNSIRSTKCASFVKTRSSTEGLCRTLNLVGWVICWVQLSSEDKASSLQLKFWSVELSRHLRQMKESDIRPLEEGDQWGRGRT